MHPYDYIPKPGMNILAFLVVVFFAFLGGWIFNLVFGCKIPSFLRINGNYKIEGLINRIYIPPLVG